MILNGINLVKPDPVKKKKNKKLVNIDTPEPADIFKKHDVKVRFN